MFITISILLIIALLVALITQTSQAASLMVQFIQALASIWAIFVSIMAYTIARGAKGSELQRTSYEELDSLRRRVKELEERVRRLEEGLRSSDVHLSINLDLTRILEQIIDLVRENRRTNQQENQVRS